MKNTEPLKESAKLSIEKTIDIIRQVRNDLIKDFLDENNLKSFFAEHYDKSLSPVKVEFLKRDLKDLFEAPVDLVHYSSLIKEIRESNSASLTRNNHTLFYAELELIFKKYIF